MRKNILTLTFLLAIQDITFSQGNLQFNKVINLEYFEAVVKNGIPLIDTLNVPANKVWKVESAGIAPIYSYLGDRLMLNNFTLDIEDYDITKNSNGYGSESKSNFPIWLSTGKYILYLHRLGGFSRATIKSSLSIIEFNVVP